jgi:hypothetical protein
MPLLQVVIVLVVIGVGPWLIIRPHSGSGGRHGRMQAVNHGSIHGGGTQKP